MSLERVFPAPSLSIDVDGDTVRTELAGLYHPPRPDWMRLNLIASVSGNAVGDDGTSESLTGRTDRLILGAIRRHADVVLVGGASIRREGYLLPRTARLAVITASGDLDGHRLPAQVESGRLMVLCPAGASWRVRQSLGMRDVEIVVLDDVQGRMRPEAVLDALRARSLTSIVCEGGPDTATRLLQAGFVDEICLTTSPVVNGATVPVFGQTALTRRPLSLSQLLVDDLGFLYARWSVSARQASR